MDKTAKFWDKIAERYSRRPVADEEAYKKKLEVSRGYFAADTEVLEIGCGTGSTATAHAPYVKHIRAIDISSKMLDIAQQKAEAQNIQNINFECAPIDKLNIADGSLDAVLGLSILHLLENMEEVIVRVHRMLKPGGVFITSTMCIGDSMKFFSFIAPIGKFFGLMPFVNIITRKELVESLTNTGFEIDYQWQPDKNKAIFIVAKRIN